MIEKARIDLFMECLDKILRGERYMEHTRDKEVDKLLILAKTIIDSDLSVNCTVREILKNQLFKQAIKSKMSMLPGNNELKEEDLQLVAAGFEEHHGEDNTVCPYCGFKPKKLYEKCPNCSY